MNDREGVWDEEEEGEGSAALPRVEPRPELRDDDERAEERSEPIGWRRSKRRA